jgi:deoxyadenosine/deoxycytidine kinase
MPHIVSLDGNIGAGKTSLLDAIERCVAARGLCNTIVVLREPVSEWREVLPRFYADPARHALAFQTLVLSTLASQLRRALARKPAPSLIICERSIFASRDVFARLLLESGAFDEVEHAVYCRVFEEVKWGLGAHARLARAIFLDTSPHACAARVAERAREGEADVALGYLKSVARTYEDWIADLDVPVLRLENDGAPDALEALAERALDFATEM